MIGRTNTGWIERPTSICTSKFLQLVRAVFAGFVILVFIPSHLVALDEIDVVNEIIRETLRSPINSDGHPLPLASHWNSGKHPSASGWSPIEQLRLIDDGHFILPWLELPINSSDDIVKLDDEFVRYYEAPVMKAATLGLPLVFVSSQWEQVLSREPYLSLDANRNPNVVTPDNQVLRMVSPFGSREVWGDVGRALTDSLRVRQLQSWYPDPPKVIFLSNNEHAKLDWRNVEQSQRYIEQYGTDKSDSFKRTVVGDGWISMYRALQEGMRDGFEEQSWKDNAIFVGYDAFGPAHFGRWIDWKDYSLYIPDRIDPHPLMWDGGSASYYTSSGNQSTDFKVWSPQIEAMNQVFQVAEARRLNPNFWFEISVWDGYIPNGSSEAGKRRYYETLGQQYSPERYAGMIQFGMWMLRPRIVREFRQWDFPRSRGFDYFLSVVEVVDRIHTNSILREWWRRGELVENPSRDHPYRFEIPEEYAQESRWYLLDSDANPSSEFWRLDEEIRVFALALVRGVSPNRQWLVYAHAPLGNESEVSLLVPGYGNVVTDVTVEGSYFELFEGESSRSVIR